jgi:hypothetical protein
MWLRGGCLGIGIAFLPAVVVSLQLGVELSKKQSQLIPTARISETFDVATESERGINDSRKDVETPNTRLLESVASMNTRTQTSSRRECIGFAAAAFLGGACFIVAPEGVEAIQDGGVASGASSLQTSQVDGEQEDFSQSLSSPIFDNSLQTASSTSASINSASSAAIDTQAIFEKASKRALSGGKAGAYAAVVQVLSLMWLRTAMNYQYRYGGTLSSALQTLKDEGGIPRLYQGLPFALVQGPLTRFGDTAANIGILALLDSSAATAGLPLPVRTGMGSIAAGMWRIVCMPIDTSKTTLQVDGAEGLTRLKERIVNKKSISPLFQGAVASAAATAVGHFPWFLTYNFLNDALPQVNSSEDLLLSLSRSALIGVCASCVSDTASNSLRVIKTTKQTMYTDSSEVEIGEKKAQDLNYAEIIEKIIEEDGIKGLFGRGLQTRLIANAIQGAAFSVLWKYFQTLNNEA